MSNGLDSRSISSMIQGVSQQAPQERRDSQCESQFDCINSPKYGVIPRPHFEYVGLLDNSQPWSNGFFYEIARGDTEHYLAMIQRAHIMVVDLTTAATVSCPTPDGTGYLGLPDYSTTWQQFTGQSVNDVHFIASRTVPPRFGPTLTGTRPPECLLFFKAGDYSMTYKVYLTFGTNTYVYAYMTPDNSVSGNKAYIDTSQLASVFANALQSAAVPPQGQNDNGATTTGAANHQGTIQTDPPQAAPAVSASSLGFTVEQSGNLIRLSRADAADFSVQVVDGNGGANLKAFKGTIDTFGDLPQGGFVGMRFQVRGASQTLDTAYYVAYAQNTDLSYAWQEVAAPGVKYAFDPGTMPWSLTNLGTDSFTFGKTVWGTRVAGDGVFNAKNPSFIGASIQGMLYYQGRLGIMTEGSCVWSKTLNPYVFFPDTVQTVQDSAPVDITFTASGGRKNQGVSLLRQSVQIDEGLFLWAPRNQFRVDSGNNPFTASSVQSYYSTSYEFARYAPLLPLGKTLYFTTENGQWAAIRSLLFYLSKPQGDTDITAHVSAYIPSGVRDVTASDSLNLMLVRSGILNQLYAYNFLISGSTVVQSAWNTWRLPSGSLAWASIYQNYLYVAMQRSDGLQLLRADLSPGVTDTGHTDYATRLDMRILSTDPRINISYDAPSNATTYVLPFDISQDLSLRGVSAMAVVTETAGTWLRGKILPVKAQGSISVVLQGDTRTATIAFGFPYVAERTESEFFLRSQDGVQSTDKLTVMNYRVQFANSDYFRAEVTGKSTQVVTWDSRLIGTAAGITGSPTSRTGDIKVAVGCETGEYSLRLVNDSPFPSAWIAAEYQYRATIRASPSK